MSFKNICVGIMLNIAVIALFLLSFFFSSMNFISGGTISVSAYFDNIGGLTEQSPIKMSGVKIGTVDSIDLDPTSYKALVVMNISQRVSLPADSHAAIYTEGLLGSNYVNIAPGYDEQMLTDKSMITRTDSAVVLEQLISAFLYKSPKTNEESS